jgi:hypothetical protein
VLTSITSDFVLFHNPILPLLIDDELEDDDCMLSQMIATVHISPCDITGDRIMDDLDPEVYPHAGYSRAIFAFSSKECCCIIMPEILSKRWYISLEAAHDTLNATQAGVFWTYCTMWCTMVRRFTASSIPKITANEFLQVHTHELEPDPAPDEAIIEEPSVINHDLLENKQWEEDPEPEIFL